MALIGAKASDVPKEVGVIGGEGAGLKEKP